jgi:hypothetical protein
MATTVTEVDASAYEAIVAGPIDLYIENVGGYEITYRVDITGAQTLTAEGKILPRKELHPCRVPDGSSLYARVTELSIPDRVSKLARTETYLGPET